MWKIGDTVLYRSSGLCRIEDIKKENFSGECEEYYVLRPLHDKNSSVLVPLSNEELCGKIMPLLTESEIDALIDTFPSLFVEWENNDKLRAQKFRAMLETGDRQEVCAVIKAVWERRAYLAVTGKKSRASDDAIAEKAERILFDEISHVLKIPRENIVSYIEERLKKS